MLNDHAKLNKVELDNVTGGSVSEFADICKAFAAKGIADNFMVTGTAEVNASIPGLNMLSAKLVKVFLQSELHIKSNIDLGWGGTGIGEESNTYTDLKTGKSLTHKEVLARIADYKG